MDDWSRLNVTLHNHFLSEVNSGVVRIGTAIVVRSIFHKSLKDCVSYCVCPVVCVQLCVSSCVCPVLCILLCVSKCASSCVCPVVCFLLCVSNYVCPVVCVQLCVFYCVCPIMCVQLCVPSCVCPVVCVQLCVQLYVFSCVCPVVCDAEIQQWIGVYMRWAAERQGRKEKFFKSLLENFTFY